MVRTDLDVFSSHLRDIGILESELGHLPHRWQHHWNKLEIPPPLPPREPPVPLVQTTPSMYERRHGRMLHKRSTMDLLWKAKMGGSSGKSETNFSNLNQTNEFFYVFLNGKCQLKSRPKFGVQPVSVRNLNLSSILARVSRLVYGMYLNMFTSPDYFTKKL